MEIDYVVSYIDFSQKEIVKLYERCVGQKFDCNANHDYIDISLTVKSVLKHMPWIRRLFITCKDVQKFDDSLMKVIEESNGKVVRVNESEFMPDNHITFSSACIEMFLWRIPGLANNFIYGNDDMVILRSLKTEDFFEDGVPHAKFMNVKVRLANLYDQHSLNNTNLVFRRIKNNDDYSMAWRTSHTLSPLTKNICRKCFIDNRKWIMGSLYKTRFYTNLNIDLFMVYGMKEGMIIDSPLTYTFKYYQLDSDELTLLAFNVLNGEYGGVHDIICVNDFYSATDEDCENAKRCLQVIVNKALENDLRPSQSQQPINFDDDNDNIPESGNTYDVYFRDISEKIKFKRMVLEHKRTLTSTKIKNSPRIAFKVQRKRLL